MTYKEFMGLPADAPERKTHALCARCQEVRELKDLHTKTIQRHYKQRHLERPENFCKDKPCAQHEQFAMEG